jgi:hypothetical protein
MGLNMKGPEKTFDEVHRSHELQMDMLGEGWKPKYPRIYGVPPILKYEAFSSWCARISGSCKISIDAILKSMDIRIPSFWVDAGKVPLDVEKIARLTLCDKSSLTHINWPFDSALSEFNFSCLTVEILNKRPIYKYCPVCLASDQTPYFRQSWRLASTYICPLHRLILRDSCHRCNNRINLSSNGRGYDDNIAPSSLLFCNRCGTSLGESPHEAIDRKFLSDVFFRQEQIENLIRSTSSYWMPSQFAEHPESLSDQYPSKLNWSVGNAQIMLSAYIEDFGIRDGFGTVRHNNKIALQKLLHLRPHFLKPYTDKQHGIFIALDGPSIFNFISPYLGLQISKYQTPNGSTIWWESTAGGLENFHNVQVEDLDRAVYWCTNFRN